MRRSLWFYLCFVGLIWSCDDGSSDQGDGIDSDEPVSTDELPAWPEGKYISIDEVYLRVLAGDTDMLLVNVSDEEFYELGHIEGSLKIPWDVIGQQTTEIDETRHVVVYCRKGVRSESAYETLIANGYPLLWVMEGGLVQWSAKGYPTVPD